MTTIEVKAWLSRAQKLKKEKAVLEEIRRETFERLTSTTGRTDGITVSSSSDPVKADALVILNDEVREKIEAIERVTLEIFEAISALDNEDYRTILYSKYLQRKSWTEIAEAIHYHKRTAERMHGAALLAIEPIISKKSF